MSKNTVILGFLITFGVLLSFDVLSCTLTIPLGEYLEANVAKSRWLWLLSAVLGVLVLGIHFMQSRGLVVPCIVVALVAFHPAWTVDPMHGPNCVSGSVRWSQVIVAVLCIFLAAELLNSLLKRRANQADNHNT